jgi:hypothetical protein
VPKDNKNEFGGFTYRNLEDIEDKVKPLLKEHELTLIFEDEIVAVGDRVYVKATAYLSDGNGEIKVSAYAREAASPKAKTDDAQLTGGTSSYARKYAASGLFLIDNTKDADSQDNSAKPPKKAETIKPATDSQKLEIKTLLALDGVETKEMPGILEEHYDIPVGSAITFAQAERVLKDLNKKG